MKYIGSIVYGKIVGEIPRGVIDYTGMFRECTALEEAPKIPDSVTNCEKMFQGCASLKDAPVIPANVKNCQDMFKGCASLREIPNETIVAEDTDNFTILGLSRLGKLSKL